MMDPNGLKGILKKTTDALIGSQNPKTDPREVAIQHAKILQHRKDLERDILESIITLSEYPLERVGNYSASNPSPLDVAGFKNHIRLFQPSDYDSLIEERNTLHTCGYTLCGKPRLSLGPGGKWKLVKGGIAARADIERWCSSKCAERALYVKVQLNETAAWERAGVPDIEIDLMDEERAPVDAAAQQLSLLRIREEKKAAEDSAALALERGDPVGGKVEVTIREKDAEPPGHVPRDTAGDEHLMMEGHKTSLGMVEPKESNREFRPGSNS
jgi:RNA polymerase II-associated protein 2